MSKDRPTSNVRDAALSPRRLESVQMRSLPQRITEAIIEAASEGKFKLGERLVEPNLARDLGVSRVPVREALRILESQGIAMAVPNQGMRLMSITAGDLDQLLAVRVAMERLAISELLKRPEKEWHNDLTQALIEIKAACDASDRRRVADSDLAFHRTFFLAARNKVALEFWGNISNRLRIIMGVAAGSREGRRRTDFRSYYEYHIPLFKAVMAGDRKAALQAIEAHILEPTQWQPVKDESQQATGTRVMMA